MSNLIYNWKRFWCLRTGSFSLADGGYLVDPDSEYGRFYNSDAVPFEAILETPCLVLLGEPGIGKSTTMNSQEKYIEDQVTKTGGATLWVNLNAFQSDVMLHKEIFENPTFMSWLNGDHVLHLYLDSLDECLLRIDNVTSFLLEKIKRYPIKRLCFCISCRTADWPIGFEEDLKQLWGNDSFGAYELLPLRRVDVVEAVKINNLNPEEFLNEIIVKEVIPFAIKPVTLEFLINIYKKDDCLPSEQKELYRLGCSILCEEMSEGHRGARITKLKGKLSNEQRLSIAASIAAVTVFANRYAIWTGIDFGNVPETDVTIKDLIRGNNFYGDHHEITEESIRETLNTGLFNSRGANRIGWAHQTYAEFLAAYYLFSNGVELVQIENLLIHPYNLEKKIVPQLREVAAWVASMMPEVFSLIMRIDPEVLLLSDVATKDNKDKAALVEKLLNLFDEDELIDANFDMYKNYNKLEHPQLAEQLKTYIKDSRKGNIVRRVAINIAIECGLKELQEELVNIALNSLEELILRKYAAHAVCVIGDEVTRKKLKPLATNEAGDDPNDELKGYGLRAVWPNHITAEELFIALTPPKLNNFIGSYKYFIHNGIIKYLQADDLTYALKWAEKQPFIYGYTFDFEDLKDDIILKAWEDIDRYEIFQDFVKAILPGLKQGYPLIRENLKLEKLKNKLFANNQMRHQIIEAIVPLIENPEQEYYWLVNWESPLVYSKDIPWMIDNLCAEGTEKTQWVWAYLINRVYNIKDTDSTEIILKAIKTNVVLEKVFAPYFELVELDSVEAKTAKEEYLKSKEMQERYQQRPLLIPPPKERIETRLNNFESGDLNAWWQLNKEMTLEPDSTHYGNEFESDITKLYGWEKADKITRNRIVAAAKRYIIEQDPFTSEWLGKKNIVYFPAFAGYRALIILLKEESEFLDSLDADVWGKWAPIIVANPISSGSDDEIHQKKIISRAYQKNPQEVIKILSLVIEQEAENSDYISIVNKFHDCWDEQIEKTLLAKVKEPELKPSCMGSLLNELLEQGNADAKKYAKSLITNPITKYENERHRAVSAASELMYYALDVDWTTILWPSIILDTEFGRELITKVASDIDRHSKSFMLRLTEDQLGDLYVWVVRQFPYSDDPGHKDAYWVGPKESVADLRNSILDYLKNKGTFDACKTIQKIVDEMPELDFLKWKLLEAKNHMRRHTWIPHQPDEILKIATNRDSRLVDNGEQLVNVIIDSLMRLETKLQGETPAAIDLWNNNPYKPKDENNFSDYVKRHLNEDLQKRGIIINREVEIRRGVGNGTGERTDIYVNAVTKGSSKTGYSAITVIIEAKGCWNPGLNTAMKEQLVDRYLKDNPCQHGIYLVGWFYSPSWDNGDPRNKKVPELSIIEAQEKFDKQACEISQNGKYIRAFVLNTGIR